MSLITRPPYSSDVTDEQWAIIEPLLPTAKLISQNLCAFDLSLLKCNPCSSQGFKVKIFVLLRQ